MLKEYTNRENLLSLIRTYQVDLVLAGHVHWDNVTIVNGTTFITTTTPESEINVEDGYWGYRMIEITNGTIDKYNYKEPKYSIPSYHLSVETWQEDRIAKATFTNDLEMDIMGHVTMVFPSGTYAISDGIINQQRTKDNQTQLFLEVPISEQSTKTVLISSIQ
jgi:glycogen synthase